MPRLFQIISIATLITTQSFISAYCSDDNEHAECRAISSLSSKDQQEIYDLQQELAEIRKKSRKAKPVPQKRSIRSIQESEDSENLQKAETLLSTKKLRTQNQELIKKMKSLGSSNNSSCNV